MLTRWIDLRIAGMLAIISCAAGCVTQKPAPLPAPTLNAAQTHYLGDAVSGPKPGTLPADAANGALVANVKFYAATEINTGKLEPLGTGARLVLSASDRQPLLATGEITSTIHWASAGIAEAFATQLDIAAPKQVVKWRDDTFVVPPGVTGSVDASDSSSNPVLRVLISNDGHASGKIECEISIESGDEQVVLRPIPIADGLTLALALPFQADNSAAKTLAAIVRVQPPPKTRDDAFTAMLQRCGQDVQRESDLVEQQLKQRLSAGASKSWPAFEAARQAASDPKTRRAAMVYLAAQTEAKFSRDVYLVADDATLARLLDDVAVRVAGASGDDRSDAALAWILDVSSLRLLGSMLSENHLTPELAAVLTDFAGEAGRHSASIDEINRNLADRAELQKRLVAENMIYLEDNSPAARVRAFDWLKLRGKAPAGFDPLASARARRDALEASAR